MVTSPPASHRVRQTVAEMRLLTGADARDILHAPPAFTKTALFYQLMNVRMMPQGAAAPKPSRLQQKWSYFEASRQGRRRSIAR